MFPDENAAIKYFAVWRGLMVSFALFVSQRGVLELRLGAYGNAWIVTIKPL